MLQRPEPIDLRPHHYIFTISTLVRSHSLCATAKPFSLSASLTTAGCTMTRANVPAARRFANVPGLMTSTDSTTYVRISTASSEKKSSSRTYLDSSLQYTRRNQNVRSHIQNLAQLQVTRIQHRAQG